MGTNYYAIKKATPEIKAKIIELVQNEHYGAAKELMPERVHLGKSSFGWQFMFDHNDFQYYQYENIREFTKECNIQDEYGAEYTDEEFWSLVEAKKGYKPDLSGKIVNGLCFLGYTNFS